MKELNILPTWRHDCPHQGTDGCCEHPGQLTPECHESACPFAEEVPTPFRLDNHPEPLAPQEPEPPEKLVQTPLFAGLDCCAGQLDLFPTDGQEPTEDA